MALINPTDPTTLMHGNGERDGVSHYHLVRGLSFAITETRNAYTLHTEGDQWRAMFFAVVPERVDSSNATAVVQWYVAKKTYDRIRKGHQ